MDNLKSLTQKENIILSNIALEKFEIHHVYFDTCLKASLIRRETTVSLRARREYRGQKTAFLPRYLHPRHKHAKNVL